MKRSDRAQAHRAARGSEPGVSTSHHLVRRAEYGRTRRDFRTARSLITGGSPFLVVSFTAVVMVRSAFAIANGSVLAPGPNGSWLENHSPASQRSFVVRFEIDSIETVWCCPNVRA